MKPTYKEQQKSKQTGLIDNPEIYPDSMKGGGMFMGKNRDFALQDGWENLHSDIRDDVRKYFEENKISWWRGCGPTGHILSSQIACLNHLFHIRDNKRAVLELLNGVRNEFVDVLPIMCDTENSRGYIGFEVISKHNWLRERSLIRGSQCTSIDAFIHAVHKSGGNWLIPIEWKYPKIIPPTTNRLKIGRE